jgi:hypothetical protein
MAQDMLDDCIRAVTDVLTRHNGARITVEELARLCVTAAEKAAIEHRAKVGACPTCGFTVSLPDTSQTYTIRKGN